LTMLSLANTPLTDEGLPPLKNLGNLRYLNLKDTKITDKRFEEIRMSLLPSIRVDR